MPFCVFGSQIPRSKRQSLAKNIFNKLFTSSTDSSATFLVSMDISKINIEIQIRGTIINIFLRVMHWSKTKEWMKPLVWDVPLSYCTFIPRMCLNISVKDALKTREKDQVDVQNVGSWFQQNDENACSTQANHWCAVQYGEAWVQRGKSRTEVMDKWWSPEQQDTCQLHFVLAPIENVHPNFWVEKAGPLSIGSQQNSHPQGASLLLMLKFWSRGCALWVIVAHPGIEGPQQFWPADVYTPLDTPNLALHVFYTSEPG